MSHWDLQRLKRLARRGELNGEQGFRAKLKEYLSNGGHPSHLDFCERPFHRTALWEATWKNHEGIVQLLVEQQADCAHKDYQGRTPLHEAAFYGHINLVQYFLNSGHPIDLRDDFGQTPLLRATEAGRESVVKLLISRKAKINALDCDSVGAQHLAVFWGDKNLSRWLYYQGSFKNHYELQEKYYSVVDSFSIMAHERIHHKGEVSEDRGVRCIASFPGKYPDKYKLITDGADDISVSIACVWLMNKEHGLGAHIPDPDNELNHCLCASIYGKLPAAAYLVIMEAPVSFVAKAEYEETLQSAREDAETMNQLLVVRTDHPDESDEDWAMRKEKAYEDAEKRCEENGGRAPWGCFWFKPWQENVHEAVHRRQRLQVFYHDGKVGHGKLAWADLKDHDKVMEARRDGGLGGSQMIEVAWLDRMINERGVQYDYDERDSADIRPAKKHE